VIASTMFGTGGHIAKPATKRWRLVAARTRAFAGEMASTGVGLASERVAWASS
jgi:hypothetical protein